MNDRELYEKRIKTANVLLNYLALPALILSSMCAGYDMYNNRYYSFTFNFAFVILNYINCLMQIRIANKYQTMLDNLNEPKSP